MLDTTINNNATTTVYASSILHIAYMYSISTAFDSMTVSIYLFKGSLESKLTEYVISRTG